MKMAKSEKKSNKKLGGTPPLGFFFVVCFLKGGEGVVVAVVATFQLQPWGETLIDKEKAENGDHE